MLKISSVGGAFNAALNGADYHAHSEESPAQTEEKQHDGVYPVQLKQLHAHVAHEGEEVAEKAHDLPEDPVRQLIQHCRGNKIPDKYVWSPPDTKRPPLFRATAKLRDSFHLSCQFLIKVFTRSRKDHDHKMSVFLIDPISDLVVCSIVEHIKAVYACKIADLGFPYVGIVLDCFQGFAESSFQTLFLDLLEVSLRTRQKLQLIHVSLLLRSEQVVQRSTASASCGKCIRSIDHRLYCGAHFFLRFLKLCQQFVPLIAL